jgi:hypothetical protein
MSLLAPYKTFVKQHPSLVLNVQRLLHWFAWNPERFSGSEYAYEAFNAVVGLLGIYHDSILAEGEQDPDLAKWALWLAAVEQVGFKSPLHDNPIVFTLRESLSLGFENQARDMMAAFIWGPLLHAGSAGGHTPTLQHVFHQGFWINSSSFHDLPHLS